MKFAFASFLLLAVTATAQVDIKGFALGGSLEEFRIKSAAAVPQNQIPFFSFGSGDSGVFTCAFIGADPLEDSPSDTFASVPAHIQYMFIVAKRTDYGLLKAAFRDPSLSGPIDSKSAAGAERTARLMGAVVTLESRSYSRVIDALRAKFGEPSGSSKEDLQTPIGARFTSIVHKWEVPGDVVIIARERDGRIDQAKITYVFTPLNELFRSYNDQQKAAAAGDI